MMLGRWLKPNEELNMNTYKTVLAILLAFAVVLFTASDALPQKKGGGKGGKSGGGGSLAVTVTFGDLPGDGWMSDCQTGDCPYIDGVDNADAHIDQQGDLYFRVAPATKKQPAIRKVFFDFSDCASADPLDCDPPLFESSGGEVFGFNTVTGVFTGGVNLRTMALNETRDDLALTGGFRPSEDSEALRFGFIPHSTKYPGSTFVTVTRTGPDTWVIEAGPEDVLSLREGGRDPVQRGLYHLPFRMTLQAVPTATASRT